MQKMDIIGNLDQRFFWDLDMEVIDPEKNKTLIIERVATRGDINDFKLLIEHYGRDEIKEQVQKCGYLDKKTLNWLSIYFDIPPNSFSCYSKIQSNQVFWNF